MKTSSPISLLIIGAGGRGNTYAHYAEIHPEEARVTGVAEPRPFYRDQMAATHNIPAENVANDWRALAERPKFADAVVIATQDALHAEPAIVFARQGYAILLEKPMAPNAEDCRRIAQAVRENGNIFAVCHVLRYTEYTQKVKQLLDSGLIGDIVSVDHIEPVGYWHMGHSFVRGNWRNTSESSFMLLAKSCHDMDWLRYIVGRRCLQVSSFGSLMHFKKNQKPAEAGAALRCLDCAFEPRCPYSAKKLYLGMFRQNEFWWPLDVITPDYRDETAILKVLRDGPYGRCVYECDNDVVDHQVVSLSYEGGATATFSMVAFTELGHRRTTIFGTLGELRGDGERIVHYDFLTDQTQTIDTRASGADAASGHGGGDFGLMSRFVRAVAAGDQSLLLSGADETLESHLATFAAEQSRLEGRTVTIA